MQKNSKGDENAQLAELSCPDRGPPGLLANDGLLAHCVCNLALAPF